MKYNLEEGDVVLCTVEKTKGATVFVRINVPGQQKVEGSIVFSEISSGRIRNIRDYVVPKKKIVCKVLRITPTNIELSLRRVTQTEQKEILSQYKQEKSYKAILKTILKDKAKQVVSKIEETESVYDFLQRAKKDSKELSKLITKEELDKILEVLKTQKKKNTTIKKILLISSTSPDGINKIKDLLTKVKNAKINYISAGKYSIKTEAEDKKTASKILQEIIENLEMQAKKQDINFSIKEKQH